MNSSKRSRAAQSFYSDYYSKLSTENTGNNTNQNITDVPFNGEETQGLLDSAALVMNKDKTALTNWVNTGSSEKKIANRQMYVNFADALYRLASNGNIQFKDLKEVNS